MRSLNTEGKSITTGVDSGEQRFPCLSDERIVEIARQYYGDDEKRKLDSEDGEREGMGPYLTAFRGGTETQ